MAIELQDCFSGHAAAYSRARPNYPASLFKSLATLAPQTECAWDCGTGNGQSALSVAQHFSQVIATDLSQQQLNNAVQHPRVFYVACTAENNVLGTRSCDLVSAAQCLHWFNLEIFFNEVQRVLKRRGIVAVWCYQLMHIMPRMEPLIEEFYGKTVGPYWSEQRCLVDDGYKSIEFPFDEISMPTVVMQQFWSLQQVCSYIRTWSASQRFIHTQGYDPVDALAQNILPLWGDPEEVRQINWPLAIRVGRLRSV